MGSVQTIKSLDPSSIRVDPKHYTIGAIMDMCFIGTLILPSVLQQLDCWNDLLRSRLIESMLLRIPLSTFYFDEDTSGTLRVVDGVQRLLAIHDYIDGVYPLECLEYFREESNGRLFNDLTPYQQRRIIATNVSVQVIDCKCPEEVKLNIFRRVRFPEHLSAPDVYRRQKYLGLTEQQLNCD